MVYDSGLVQQTDWGSFESQISFRKANIATTVTYAR